MLDNDAAAFIFAISRLFSPQIRLPIIFDAQMRYADAMPPFHCRHFFLRFRDAAFAAFIISTMLASMPPPRQRVIYAASVAIIFSRMPPLFASRHYFELTLAMPP
jgi:hypothetical protein